MPSRIPFDITVTPDHLWVMGDNRSDSADSRYHIDDGVSNGMVPIANVQGVAEAIYWPLNHWSSLHRPDDVFEDVPSPTS